MKHPLAYSCLIIGALLTVVSLYSGQLFHDTSGLSATVFTLLSLPAGIIIAIIGCVLLLAGKPRR